MERKSLLRKTFFVPSSFIPVISVKKSMVAESATAGCWIEKSDLWCATDHHDTMYLHKQKNAEQENRKIILAERKAYDISRQDHQ